MSDMQDAIIFIAITLALAPITIPMIFVTQLSGAHEEFPAPIQTGVEKQEQKE